MQHRAVDDGGDGDGDDGDGGDHCAVDHDVVTTVMLIGTNPSRHIHSVAALLQRSCLVQFHLRSKRVRGMGKIKDFYLAEYKFFISISIKYKCSVKINTSLIMMRK